MKSLVVGRGAIGNAVAEIISKRDVVITYDITNGRYPNVAGVDVLHICFPYNDDASFLAAVQSYINHFTPMHVIIWSTVGIGTTKQVNGAVHSPVEGRHPALAMSIRNMVRWIGSSNKGEAEFFAAYFKKISIKTHLLPSSDFTEFLKLRSTAKFGINLAWTDYEAETARSIGMDFHLLKDFDKDYNRLYRHLGMPWAQRYILDDPAGKIGGHCVVPNAKLLDNQFPSDLLKKIIDMEVQT